MRAEIDYAGSEAIGQRNNQEDFYAFAHLEEAPGSILLAVLADGMGGEIAGALASRSAVEAFIYTFQVAEGNSVKSRLMLSLDAANKQLANLVKESNDLDGMGTTLVGLALSKDGLEWVSVGDSPLFLFRNRYLQRLNADHSMQPLIDDEVRSGKIRMQEAASHPDRNALRSVVSGYSIELTDSSSQPLYLQHDDLIVLASDGLLTLNEASIQKVLQGCENSESSSITSQLVTAVLECANPRQDNLTVLVISGRLMLQEGLKEVSA